MIKELQALNEQNILTEKSSGKQTMQPCRCLFMGRSIRFAIRPPRCFLWTVQQVSRFSGGLLYRRIGRSIHSAKTCFITYDVAYHDHDCGKKRIQHGDGRDFIDVKLAVQERKSDQTAHREN